MRSDVTKITALTFAGRGVVTSGCAGSAKAHPAPV